MPMGNKVAYLALLSILVGLCAGPLVVDLETKLGLNWLFKLRGPIQPPEDVVVIGINSLSLQDLGIDTIAIDQHISRGTLPPGTRALHAKLVNQLAAAGAKVIVFDINFDKTRDLYQDLEFAKSIKKAGNVVLFESLNVKNPKRLGIENPIGLSILRRQPPISTFAHEAAATAPFPLPKLPVQLSQLWLFKGSAGGLPTLPVVALQVYAEPYQKDWLHLLGLELDFNNTSWRLTSRQGDLPTTAQLIRHYRQLFHQQPSLKERLLSHLHTDKAVADPQARAVLVALIELYSGHPIRYLNYYGPSPTLTVIPYQQVMQALVTPGPPKKNFKNQSLASEDFRGKAVFIGFVEHFPAHQQDNFYTVFSKSGGLDLSGVEIAATAFANLLQRSFIEPVNLFGYLLTVSIWGLVLGTMCMVLPGIWVIPSLLVIAGSYVGLSHSLFFHYHLWLPLVTPLLIQAPFAIITGFLWRYTQSSQEKRRVRQAFTYYLPDAVIDELTRSGADLPTQRQPVFGVCLDSDAAHYTHFSETLSPDRLHTLLNRYYEALFEPVKQQGGFISDVIGDAMLAIWSAPTPDPTLREQACLAALNIIAAVDRFNRSTTDISLPTRLGLHCGPMLLGNVGAGDHYEYRAVGDTVNTACRIQSLNKQLGTNILVTHDMIQGLESVAHRELGTFRLTGKRSPLVIYELVGKTADIDGVVQHYHQRFAKGVALFRAQCWRQAGNIFRELLKLYPDDGPIRYYVQICERYAHTPKRDYWDGVINIRRIADTDLGRHKPR
jgi:adenylate cyclase